MLVANILFALISLCFTGFEKELPQLEATALVWGYDNAGFIPDTVMEVEIIREFGFELAVFHYWPRRWGNQNEVFLGGMSEFYEKHNVQWILNTERANWSAEFVDGNGYDWYNRPDGRHYFMFPDNVLNFLSGLSHKPGILYDEAGHMQNSLNHEVNKPYFLMEGDVQSLEEANAAFTQQARGIAEIYQNHGLEVYSEHVFPVQFHALADAGFIPVSKVLKENNIPAYIACALGACIQYDKPFCLTPDLWGLGHYPGHTTEEYKSALLMAYHMGAEAIYTENLGYDGAGDGEGQGGLIKVDSLGQGYQTTAWGDVALWFRWEYEPGNPRYYSYKDIIPKVAIIRQEDACWGQSDSPAFLEKELYGIEGWHRSPATEAWLEIWNLLSNGQINKNSISWHNNKVKVESPYQVFYPLDGVVVFDEKVGGEHLVDVELIFLTGIGVSEATLSDVKARVQQGALCVSLPTLAPAEIVSQTGNNGSISDGEGQWLISESFLSTAVQQAVQPYLPQENYMRYQFGDTEVQFRPVDGNNNEIEVEVKEYEEPVASLEPKSIVMPLHIYPNPASDRYTLHFSTEQAGEVVIKVFDIYGRLMSSDRLDIAAPGRHEYSGSVATPGSGSYFIRLESETSQANGMLNVE
ncbi:MAG: T9SS type A sorting domain-containing protein [Bacteroidetes bacterium]|nr:T9SS type A sorting domain-containing protein [Bacteroidota bacterium]